MPVWPSLWRLPLLRFAAVVVMRGRNPAQPETDPMDGLVQAQNAAAQRLEAMIRMLGDRQSQLQHAVNERLDAVSHRLGDSIQKTTAHTTENLQKLHERLAVIDSAQKNITDARHAGDLAAKRARQQAVARRLRAVADGIDRSGLPAQGRLRIPAYAVEPHPPRLLRVHAGQAALVIDAKFPLEGVTAYRDAKSDDERQRRRRSGCATDVGKHIADIAGKYLIPGETQEFALMFVPSEAVYAEVHDGFDDLVQQAYRERVVLMSPSLLMLAIALVQQSQKDARMREAADQIRDEVARLVKDVSLLGDRVRKLQGHFNQSNEDIRQAIISVEKIESRGEKIQQVDVGILAPVESNVIAAPMRKLEAGE